MKLSETKWDERLACSYGVHDFEFIECASHVSHHHQCVRCGAQYQMLDTLCRCKQEGILNQAREVVSAHVLDCNISLDETGGACYDNKWRGSCSCNSWSQTATYKSSISSAWNMHVYKELLNQDITLQDLLD